MIQEASYQSLLWSTRQRLGDTREIFPVLFGLWGFYQTKGDVRTACELGERLFTLAQR
jgi:hypothetical protein